MSAMNKVISSRSAQSFRKKNIRRRLSKEKKSLKAIKDSYDSLEAESEEELSNITLMAHVEFSKIYIHSVDEEDCNSEEISLSA